MQRVCSFYFFFIFSALLLSCGATPGLTNLTPDVDKNLPVYTYLDSNGNTYSVSANKLIYDPVSAENTTDGIADQGYHLELNISLNDYSKIAAAFKTQLARSQEDLPATYSGFSIPSLTTQTPQETETLELDLTAVQDINYVLKPFLEDE